MLLRVGALEEEQGSVCVGGGERTELVRVTQEKQATHLSHLSKGKADSSSSWAGLLPLPQFPTVLREWNPERDVAATQKPGAVNLTATSSSSHLGQRRLPNLMKIDAL